MRVSFNSPIVLLFTIICCVQLLVSALTHGGIDVFFVSPAVFDFSALSSWVGLVLHIFGHSSFEHLVGNMTLILLMGPILEEKYGSGLLLFMILVTAVLTSCINAFLFDAGIIGASGIVFMMIVLSSFVNVRSGTLPVTFILIVVLYIGKELYESLTPSNVSHFAHILGGCAGGAFGLMFSNNKK